MSKNTKTQHKETTRKATEKMTGQLDAHIPEAVMTGLDPTPRRRRRHWICAPRESLHKKKCQIDNFI